MEDIKDAESLQAWLESLPQETEEQRETARRWAVTIAHRAAMRSLPYFWQATWKNVSPLRLEPADPNDRNNALGQIMRCMLVSCVNADAAIARTAISETKATEYPQLPIVGAALASVATNLRIAALYAKAAASLPLRFLMPSKTLNESDVYSAQAATDFYTMFFHSASEDALALERDASVEKSLWPADADVLHDQIFPFWHKFKNDLLSENEGWRFWVEWYENALYGRPQDYDLLTKIALIDPADWDKGADHVNALIQQIVAEHKPASRTTNDKVAEIASDRLIRAAIGNFTFDAMAKVMQIVPFAEDIRFMRDPAALQRVMDDVGAIHDQLQTFQSAMERRAQTQGSAGDIAAYLKSILEEFERGQGQGELRVGNIIEYGSILQHYCLDEHARAELRPLDNALQRHVSVLLEITHRHFASTFLRFEPLRELTLEDDLDAHSLLLELRDHIRGLKTSDPPEITPLAQESWAVLDAMADDIDRHIRQHFVATDDRVKESLKRELDFKLAQLSVSLALYGVKGREQANTVGRIADRLVTLDERVKTIGGLWAIIRQWLQGAP
ncbi:MAG: hypothetical protein GVY34_00925 [Alphaproteobacteria bacterium]|nr:hypothetical protein [Alphaproteobacteria bacterium]